MVRTYLFERILMKKWQLWCAGLLVLSLTSCGDNTTATSPTSNPTTSTSPVASSETPLVPSSTSSPVSPASSKPAVSKTVAASPLASPDTAAVPAATESAETSLDNSGGAGSSVSKASLAALQGVIDATKTAVEAGKLDEAKTEFAKFSDSWQAVQDGVKSKSADTYKAVEDSIKSVNTGIASKQAKGTLLASLQKLSQSVESAGN